MKVSGKKVYTKSYAIPSVNFEDQELTSFGGLVIFQKLFHCLNLRERLIRCCKHLDIAKSYKHGSIVQILIVHLLLGYRKLQEAEFYRDDRMVRRTVGMNLLPSTSTISRYLTQIDRRGEKRIEDLSSSLVEERLSYEMFPRVTLGFDGSVLSTTGHPEGSAVGFNRKKKGARSYYPLLCTIAQTGQVFSVLHRSGNVHDSNGSVEFVRHCVERIRKILPRAVIEVRFDGAFFSEAMVKELEALGVQYTISVPFERFPELKKKIERRSVWWTASRTSGELDYFEQRWQPKSWKQKGRFLFVRKHVVQQRKEPLQLDLFEPRQPDCEYKVVLTNKSDSAKKVIRFHEGRGNDEGIYGELKDQLALGYVPGRKWVTNRLFLIANVMAHNLTRELQMSVAKQSRATNEKRTPHWIFEGIQSMRRKFLHRAARLVRPDGRLTLSMQKNAAVEEKFSYFLNLQRIWS